ncbi:GSCOCG00013546001-RA-CDS [Cotesia congregata]|nr:GSCOCG00013546001-RA-CDS [Cotesia congregata]
MYLHKNFCFKYLIIIIIIIINQAYAIDYTIYRSDPVPSLEFVASAVPPIENLLNTLIATPSNSLQNSIEKLLEYGGLVRLKLLSKLGFEIYNNDKFELSEVTALNNIYQRILKRKDNLLKILPVKNSTLQQFCSQIDKFFSDKSFKTITSEIPLILPPAPTSVSVNLSLNSILTQLKHHKLKLTTPLFIGMLLHVPFNNYDAHTHNSMRHLIFYLVKNSDFEFKTSTEHLNYNKMTDLVYDILISEFFQKATTHARYLSDQLEPIIPFNSNIEELSVILEDNKINLKFLLDRVLPNDTLDGDLIDAKNYLYHKLKNIKNWDINELIGDEKYEYLNQDQLLIGLFDKLIDLDFVKDIASALKVNAYFWHKSHMIENLNDLLDLFDNYNNLKGVTTYRELIKTISRIKENLIDSNNITIELLCTRPRACLKQGLNKVRQCKGINLETKSLINNFFKQTRDCHFSECITEKCNENYVLPIELNTEVTSEPDCEDSEECESDEVKASMVDIDKNIKGVKKIKVKLEESKEESSTESLRTTEGNIEETTEHIEVVKVITEAPTTEAEKFITTEVITTTEPTTEFTIEPSTEVSKTQIITERSTNELFTTVEITEPTTTVKKITEPSTEQVTDKLVSITKKPKWISVAVNQVSLKPSISVNLQREPEVTSLEIKKSTRRASIKKMPTLNIKNEIEAPKPTISIFTTVSPKRKRVICHHRDLYHRKKLKKINNLKQKQNKLFNSVIGSKNVNYQNLKLDELNKINKINKVNNLKQKQNKLINFDTGSKNVNSQNLKLDEINKVNKVNKVNNLESNSDKIDDIDSGNQKVSIVDKNSNLGDNKVDLHVQSHSGELGLHSDSTSGKVEDLLSHSDLKKQQLHSNSKFNSSLGEKSDSGSVSDSGLDKISQQYRPEIDKNPSDSTGYDHSNILENTYNLATKDAKKIKQGIGSFNPFSRPSKYHSVNYNENNNININNARRSRLGSKIFDSSEEMPQNSDKSDISGSDQDLAEQEDNYFENRNKTKKSKEFSKIKNSKLNQNHHKKMTSYYNEEVKEEKVKTRRSNSVRRSHSSKNSKKTRRADQNHKGYHNNLRKNNFENNSSDGPKSRMLDLDMTKFMNFEVKRDETVRKKVPTYKRSVDQGQIKARVFREIPYPPNPLTTSETEVKPRMFNIGASKFANIEFKKDENYTEFKK